MKKSVLIVSFIASTALALAPIASAAEEQKNRIHGGVSFVSAQGDPKIDVDEGGGDIEHVRAEIDDDWGFYADYERMIADKWGIKFGANWSDQDVDISGGTTTGHFGSLQATPITANILFHPAPLSHVDFYIGGGFAYVMFDDIHIENDFGGGGRDTLEIDDDTTWNAQLGVDFRFGDSPFGLNLDAKYIKMSGDSELGDLKVDPLIAGAALAIRW